MQFLLSLPPNLVKEFADLEGLYPPEWVAACDPPGSKLGSGGGTAHLLAAGWKSTSGGVDFASWLNQSQKVLIHAGGQSRRLPAYAPAGKILLPVPVFRWSRGQRLNQTLLDLQTPLYRRILAQAPASLRVMVTSGDVLLRTAGALPPLPAADVVCLGVWVTPETASHHGVFFCPRHEPEKLAFFLQKPTPAEIQRLAPDYLFLVDTGAWLLSERAVNVLLGKCGWDKARERFRATGAHPYELYADFGLGLGAAPTRRDAEIQTLTTAVVPLPQGEFHHFGTTREVISSAARLQNIVVDQRAVHIRGVKAHPDMFKQNCSVQVPLTPANHTLWLENATVPASWTLTHDHVITGVPDNDWPLRLPPGACLDFVPIGDTEWCVRVYGIDDPFRGAMGDAGTRWQGAPAQDWLRQRGISLAEADLTARTDIQLAPLFPVLSREEITGEFIQWLLDAGASRANAPAKDAAAGKRPRPTRNPSFRTRWLRARRFSAMELAECANLRRLYAQRRRNLLRILPTLAENYRQSIFYHLDLEATAAVYAASAAPLPVDPAADADLMERVHDRMFRAAVLRRRNDGEADGLEQQAFLLLRNAMLTGVEQQCATPVRQILDDQIVWGRAPVRLDLAGGWTDTPPYCILNGGRVVNLAVELNGQPPLQVFARLCPRPEIVLRSIDLGVEERVRTYRELADYTHVGSAFAIAKAALALAGFLPRFQARGGSNALTTQLREFGGGIELSLLAAVPKGSGLGTSSILAATVLGVLNDFCGLGWDQHTICRRVLVLEQMLTTGGGWQDQSGGVLRGLKLIETAPGLIQTPLVRWLPSHLFTDPAPKQVTLLYYTGITRVAKGILQEIVRGMFLNSGRRLAVLDAIGEHASTTYEALLRGDWPGLCSSVNRSWELNQALDEGTNPPAVQAILHEVHDYLAGAKLLGAGGGGYLLMLAKDAEAAGRIRRRLTETPPNRQARFVQFNLSETGLQVTRS